MYAVNLCRLCLQLLCFIFINPLKLIPQVEAFFLFKKKKKKGLDYNKKNKIYKNIY